MKKLLTRIMATVAGFAMAIGVGVGVANQQAKAVYAEDATYSLTPDADSTGSNSTSYITSLTEFTHAGISWKMNQWNPSTLQVRTNQSSAASEFRFYNTSAFSGRIKSVVITFSSFSVSDASKLMFLGGTSEKNGTSGGTAGSWNSTNKTLTWTPASTDNFTYFAFYQNGKAASGTNNLASEDAIVVTYEESGEEPPELTPLDAPTISLNGTVISWTNVEGNNGYSYSITGEETKNGNLVANTTSLDVSTLGLAYGNYSITVVTKGNGTTTSDSVASNAQAFVLTEPTVYGEFNRFTKTLVEGDYVVCSGDVAMKNAVTSSPRIDVATPTIANNKITNPKASIVWHIAKDGDYWTFYNSDVEKYAAFTGTDGRGTLISSVTDYARFTATGSYDFVNVGKSGKYLRYNSGYGFASYGSGTGEALTLYKKFVAATSISLDNDELLIGVGLDGNLVATLTPSNADSIITWSSSDEEVAKVNQSGVVTGVDAGSATITARVNETIFAECEVTVTSASIPAESVTLNKNSNTIVVGQTDSLTAEVLPDNTTDNLVWSSTNTDVATVEDGLVTAVGAGSATIKATVGEQVAEYALTVQALTAATNYVGANVNIKGKVVAVNGKSAMIDDGTSGLWTYSSSNVTAKVDDVVTVTGTTTNYNGGLEVASAVLTASEGEINTISAEPISEQQVADIIAARAGDNSYHVIHRKVSLRTGIIETNGNYLVWPYGASTMETSISTGGMVAGKVYDIEGYLVNIYNSMLCICVTDATEAEIAPESISLNKTNMTVEIGEQGNLVATISPNGATANVTWSSSDEDVATVNQNGVVTGVGAGTATITVRVSETIFAECEVKVIIPTQSSNQTLFTADLTDVASVDNNNLTITAEAESKTGYYQDGSGSERYFLVKGTSTLFSFEPSKIVFTAVLGGGSAKDPLTNNVEVCFVDSDDNEIESTRTVVTSAITAKDGSEFTVTIPYSENAYGIKLSHVKETGYNVRYYSFSLSYGLGSSRAVLSGNETNDGNAVTVDSVKMTFGASVSAEVWNEFGTIEDYGVMMYKTTKALNAISENSVRERFRNGKAVADFHKGSGEATPDGDVYNFSAYVSFSDDTNYDVVVCVAPYIVINGTYYFFDEMHYSVNLLAQYHLANGGSNLSEDALNVLAGN